MINALQAFETFDRNRSHASERQCASPFDLTFTLSFSLLAVCLKVSMLEYHHFSQTAESLHYDG